MNRSGVGRAAAQGFPVLLSGLGDVFGIDGEERNELDRVDFKVGVTDRVAAAWFHLRPTPQADDGDVAGQDVVA